LDGRKAFDVYKETVRKKNTDHTVTLDTFSSIGALHPFGMIKTAPSASCATDQSGRRRAPGLRRRRAGECHGGDSEGRSDLLIKTSAVAARDCLVSNDFITQTVLVADCISRRMYLQAASRRNCPPLSMC
jgi:hypothetical protein